MEAAAEDARGHQPSGSGVRAGRRPTLEQVARVAGVSRATVSRVVNRVESVDPDIRAAVEQAIAETGYVPNRAARTLVTGRTGTVGLVVSEPRREPEGGPLASHVYADPFFGRIVAGILGELGPRRVHPMLIHVDSAAARDELLGRLGQGDIDGVALVSVWPDDPLPDLLGASGAPAVLFTRANRPAPVSYVDVDHRHGAGLAAGRLQARGCRRVVTVAGPGHLPAGQDRLAGFRDAMARHGQPQVPSAEGGFTLAGGQQAMTRLLAEVPELDGVFAASDLMAQGALLVLAGQGRRVPGQVAVVGFDDSSAAVACRPPLTTVRQPVEEMAAQLGRLLLARIEDPALAPRSVTFEPTLVLRESA
ncbi:MAG TPA: LacI family DNA-binding transcriptional regulator [Streptosporangiaceae bacterium]